MTQFQRRRLVVGLAAFLLLFLLAFLLSVRRIQDDRVAFVEQQLRAAGLSGIGVTFSGRDGTLSGPADQEDLALAAVKDLDGIHVLTYSPPTTLIGTPPGTTTVPGGDPGTTVAAPTTLPAQGLTVTAVVAGPNVTLSGNVPTDADKQALLAAANGAFGAGKAVDQVQVIGGAWDPPAKLAFDGLQAYLGAAGARLRSGDARIIASTLDTSGIGFSNEAAASLNQTLEQVRATGVTVNATIQQPPPSADGPALQAGLNDLLGRSGINFAAGSAVIDAASRTVLDTAAQAIVAGPPGATVEVGGHTDSAGSATSNQRLSLQRAQAVRLYLATKGVPASRVTAVGYGSTKPVADNGTPEGRAQNRRIEFTVSGS